MVIIMKKEIFREYDIRGIYPKELNEQDYEIIGKAFASYIEEKDVIIGHDNRLSSEKLSAALTKGLMSAGAHVLDLGLCTTPMYYAIKKKLKYKNGLMITASHNPKEYNGLKISFAYIGNAFGSAITDFRDFVFKKEFKNGKGTYQVYDNTEQDYLDIFKKGINLGKKKLKVAFDMGNGTGGIIVRKILDLFDFEYTILCEKSDGTFPTHHPDPAVPDNMQLLMYFVKENDYDIGIGIDGDADRAGFVDNKGNYVSIDKIMIYLYRYLYPTMKKKKAVMDVKCSKALIDECNKIKLPIEVCRTGASIANYKINKEHLTFGGEFSGHLWFSDKHPCFDDGIYSGLRVVEMLSNINVSLSDLEKTIPTYYATEEIKYPIEDNKKTKLVNDIKKYLRKNNIIFNDVDGIRVDFKDGFALIRQSNTTPNLTLRFEKKDPEELKKLKSEYLNIINEIKKTS